MRLQFDLNLRSNYSIKILYTLKEWTNEWQIKFNSLKCKVMHSRKSSPKYKYKIAEAILGEVKVGKDIGIFI